MMASRLSVIDGRAKGAGLGRLAVAFSPPLAEESAEVGAQLAPRASLKISLASSCRSAKKEAQLGSTELGSST
jgi:hypothetical protein